MTNRADIWLGNRAPNAQPGNTEQRGMDTARRIDDRSSIIVVMRRNATTGATTMLAPQEVRVEVMQNVRSVEEPNNQMMAISKQYVVVIGNKNHPELPDTDLTRNDLFFYQGRMYEVIEFVDTVPGRLLVNCELRP